MIKAVIVGREIAKNEFNASDAGNVTMNNDWVGFARGLAARIEPRTEGVSFTLDQLLVELGGDQEPQDFRARGFWLSVQRGDPDFDAVAREGLSVNFSPDASGTPVEQVRFYRRQQ